jgi:hypothetical protein
MGTFRIDLELENPRLPGNRRTLRSVLVDTRAEPSWVPADILASLGIERRSQWLFRQVDPVRKQLVDAGPAPAAAVS